MKANQQNRPAFRLMTLSHVISFYHMQMPRWLFSDTNYAELSLESKVAYTFLLNRFQLSRRNGWVNKLGEVYVIYTRANLAAEMQISYKKAIACFKELTEKCLLWEQRMGRGMPNRIYMAEVESQLSTAYSYDCAPFSPAPRSAETACLEETQDPEQGGTTQEESVCNDDSSPIENALLDMPKRHVLNGLNDMSCGAEFACLDVPVRHTKKKEFIKKEFKNMDQEDTTVTGAHAGDQEKKQLNEILQRCELGRYESEEQVVLRDAVIWLFYCDSLRAGQCTYPMSAVRDMLVRLTPDVLDYALYKIRHNDKDGLSNTLVYIAKIVFCSISEMACDDLLDPVINKWKRGHAT